MILSSPINDRYFHEWFSQPIVSNPEISSCSDTNFVDMSCSQWSDNCSGNSFSWILLISNVTVMNIHRIIECFLRFRPFRTWSFTLFKNDMDSTENSDSVSSFPMINCCGLAPLWGITMGYTVLSRGVASFTMDCAVPSCWVFSRKKLDWDSCAFPKRSQRVAPI